MIFLTLIWEHADDSEQEIFHMFVTGYEDLTKSGGYQTNHFMVKKWDLLNNDNLAMSEKCGGCQQRAMLVGKS